MKQTKFKQLDILIRSNFEGQELQHFEFLIKIIYIYDSEVTVQFRNYYCFGSLFLFNYADMKYQARRRSTVWEREFQSNFLLGVIVSCIKVAKQ